MRRLDPERAELITTPGNFCSCREPSTTTRETYPYPVYVVAVSMRDWQVELGQERVSEIRLGGWGYLLQIRSRVNTFLIGHR